MDNATTANRMKAEIISEAAKIVQDRGDSYGPPAEHFGRTIGAINAIFAGKLREPLTPADWAMFMIIDKLARQQERGKYDNLLDVIGYAACAHACGAE